MPLRDRSLDRVKRQLSDTRLEVLRLESKVRDLVDHIALLRSPQVTADDILLQQLRTAQQTIARYEADRARQVARMRLTPDHRPSVSHQSAA
jgi:hypothetical protein